MNHISTAQQECEDFIENLFQSDEEKIHCLALLADAIRHAHTISPAGWSVTKFATGLRLNVGPVEAMVITRDRVFVLLDDVHTIPAEFSEYITPAKYPSVKGDKFRFDGSPSQLRKMDAFIRTLLMRFVGRASVKADGSARKTNYPGGFSPDVIELISRSLATDVPYPSHWNGETYPVGETGGDEVGASEGTLKLQVHQQRERNQAIVNAKKAAVFNKTGDLACEGCGFSFYQKYGDIGKDVCEIHHRNPLGEGEEDVITRLDDLAVVCSNCHTIIHKSNPMLSVGALSEYLRNDRY